MKLGSNSSLKLMMGATIAIVAIVLSLFLLLFAQLFCSLFLRRRRKTTTTTSSFSAQQPNTQSLRSFYSHGVVDPPPQQHLATDLRHLMMMYISNPIYDQEARAVSTTISNNADNSSETPAAAAAASSPPISPMKKLPPECPSAQSICTVASPAVSNYGDVSSSSPSPSTSPSW